MPRWIGGQSTYAMREHMSAGSPHASALQAGSLARAVGMLRSWMRSRPILEQSLRGSVRFVDAEVGLQFAPTGMMFGWDLATASSCPASYNQRGFHGCALYTLQSILSNGLGSGWSPVMNRGVSTRGIYHHLPEQVHLCNNHMLHTALDFSGWFFGPVLELRYPVPDPGGRANQVRRFRRDLTLNVAHADCCVVVGLFFHVVHWTHFRDMAKGRGHFTEGLFQREWEIDPALSFHESVEHSQPRP